MFLYKYLIKLDGYLPVNLQRGESRMIPRDRTSVAKYVTNPARSRGSLGITGREDYFERWSEEAWHTRSKSGDRRYLGLTGWEIR